MADLGGIREKMGKRPRTNISAPNRRNLVVSTFDPPGNHGTRRTPHSLAHSEWGVRRVRGRLLSLRGFLSSRWTQSKV